MNHALQQGMIGSQQQTLQGSAFALGPNRYLTEKDFLKMLAVAFVAHAMIFGVASLFPSQKVTDIPVRALNFRLGDGERVEPLPGVGVEMQMAPEIAPPAMQSTEGESWRATPEMPAPIVPAPLKPVPQHSKPQPKAVPVKPQAIELPREPSQRISPVENQPETLPPPAPVANGLPNPELLTQPAVAPNPQQYVREVGAAPQQTATPASAGDGGETVAVQQVRARYEQQISNWIQQHKYYPAAAGGKAGRTVLRIRIDRTGAVRYYAIDESSGNSIIDAAAIDMIRRANPMPAVPANYPAANLIEFLIPLNFAP